MTLPQYSAMAPKLVREPFHRDGWVYEEKVDDWRIVAYKAGERVRLVSRQGVDHTRRFRNIAAAIEKLLGRSLVLDGEVAIYDQQLRARFELGRRSFSLSRRTGPHRVASVAPEAQETRYWNDSAKDGRRPVLIIYSDGY